MGTKEVKFSDLSGQLLADDDQPVRLVVLEHPDLNSGPVALEALPHEVRPAVDAALSVAVFELHAGDDEPRRVVVDVGDFDALATDQPMKAVLNAAEAVKPSGKRTPTAAVNYATMEHAGRPHRGKVTAEEARIVREHLADVNARLAAEQLRQIDPANPADAEKYGFAMPVPELADLDG